MRWTGGGTVVTAATALLTTSCGGEECSAFAASPAADGGGAASPVEAAELFARQDDTGWPDDGWQEEGRDPTAGAVVRSGSRTLHALPVSDGTWVVDSGRTC